MFGVRAEDSATLVSPAPHPRDSCRRTAIMSDDVYREHKLAEAIQPGSDADAPALNAMPEQSHATLAEQQREADESQQAQHAQGGMRDRLVDIGKANHMAGRGNG